jgi:hypothetical protein
MEADSVRETLAYVKCWGSIHRYEYIKLRMLKTVELHERACVLKLIGIRHHFFK